MQKKFPGYFTIPKERVQSLWKTGVFVFDANILLGLYRYSDATRKEFIATLALIKDRCWLPHQAVKEYFDNRLSVIGAQQDAYSEIVKSMEDIEKRLKSAHQHPFLPEEELNKLCKSFETARAVLEKSKALHTKRINDDDVLRDIESVFGDRVGEPYSENALKTILVEGEERYKKHIPPGFRDGRKDDPTDETRKYGDLFLWKQLLGKAEQDKVGIIFVCDDRKDDWWLQFKGKTVGPRPELVKEFKSRSECDFYMYTSDRFLEFAGKQLNRDTSKVALSEMRELKEFDKNSFKRSIVQQLEKLTRARRFETELLALMRETQEVEAQRNSMRLKREEVYERLKLNPATATQSDFKFLEETASILPALDERYWQLNERVRHTEHMLARTSEGDEQLQIID